MLMRRCQLRRVLGQDEFYQLLSYKGAVDLEAKLSEWETFYNFNRPHGAFKGKAPYEELRERL
jgi:transposase InsO family protein